MDFATATGEFCGFASSSFPFARIDGIRLCYGRTRISPDCNPFSSQVARSSILRCSGAIGQNQVPLRKDHVDAAEFYHSGGR